MAIINGKTFEIYSHSVDPKTLKNCFECDDLIAPIIRTLNLKGYTTTYCCAGHPYIEESEAIVYSTIRPSFDLIPGTYYVRKVKNKKCKNIELHHEMNAYKVRFAQYLTRESYILFKEGCVPDTIPACWGYNADRNIISREYLVEKITPLEFFKEQLKCMEELQKWADSLPKKE